MNSRKQNHISCFNGLIQMALTRGACLLCEDCDELRPVEEFNADNYVLNDGSLFCENCFREYEQ